MAVQSTYAENFDTGIVGDLVSGENFNALSRTVESSGGVGFGRPVWQGSADRGCVKTRTPVAAGSEDAGNTGTGEITDAPAATNAAKTGRYTVLLNATSATGLFTVFDPDGLVVGTGNIATEFVGGGLTFTWANGGTMTAGDKAYIDVTAPAFVGVTRRNPALSPEDSDTYQQYAEAGIVDEAVINVQVEHAVTARAQAYWNPTAGKWSVDATNDVKIPGAYFDAAGSTDEVVPLRLRAA